MTHKLIVSVIFAILLAGCDNLPENEGMVTVKKTFLDSLTKQAEECKKWKEEEVADKKNTGIKKSLEGQYDVFKNSLSDGNETLEKSYSLIIQNVLEPGYSDPN